MAICYGCVAIRRMGIIAEYSADSKWNFKAVVASMLPNIATQNTEKIFDHPRYNFVVLPDKSVLYICATTPDFPAKDSFTFLEELKEALNNKNNNLHGIVEECPGDEESVTILNENIEIVPSTTTVPLDVKKMGKLSAAVEEKMKRYNKNRKKPDKSKKILIPPVGGEHKHNPSGLLACMTPSSKGKYIPLPSVASENEQDECAPVWTHQKSYSGHDVKENVQTPPRISGHTVKSLQNQVDEIEGIVREAIETALTRGENLDDLLERSEDLKAAALQFKTVVKRMTAAEKRKATCIVIAVVGVLLIAAAVVAIVLLVCDKHPNFC